MIRKILQDVIPPEKKSIRHIPLPGNRKPPVMERVGKETSEPPKIKTPRRKRNLNLSRWSVSVGAIVVLVAIIIGLSWYFASATVTIKPKQATAAVDIEIRAETDASAALAYTLITATSTASEILPTNREENVEKKASGQIVIYNNYSSGSQRLIKNTRFEATDGRIYKIDSSVVVPGQKVEGGKKVPGSVTVTVYADVAGSEYNLPLSELKGDFTIPGFKGLPQFQSFYARQKTDIIGGFSGRARVVDDASLDEVENSLKARLEQETWDSLGSTLPAEYVLFQTLYTVDFSVSTKDNPGGDGVLVEVIAVGRAAAFNKTDLSSFIAAKSLTGYDTSEVVLIENLSEVSLLPAESTEGPLWEKGSLTLDVKGNVRFVWQFDENTLKESLAGRNKKDTDSILRSYKAIERASVIIKPSWRSKYPENTKRIHAEIKLD